MEITNAQRAEVLTCALPYIQQYTNKIVVIKYGGNAMVNEELKTAVMGDLVLLSLTGIKTVLVHGGGPEITSALNRMNIESKFVDGLRVTDKETADIVQMVLAGKVNKDLVKLLGAHGGRAIGLSGVDAGMIKARPVDERLGFVGEITSVDPRPILDLLDNGYIPIISTVGCDDDGNIYNINADTAACAIAASLGAESLITMTDINGIMRDTSDESTLIPLIRADETSELLNRGIISGGMIPKVESCIKAVNSGVKKVIIIDGRVPHSIIIEMFTNEGIGTMFIK
ncbi:MAG: acetylglutamate kinase [Oscillospiraceae bacterium]|nr:acetylglutamate kinase [Oscillospiraceae bacterium]